MQTAADIAVSGGGKSCGGRMLRDELELHGLGALAHTIRLDLERDLLTVGEMADASLLKSADVDEHVLRTTLRGDEAETLGRIEKLYCANLARHALGFLLPLV
jgi:hypothetical protein